MINETELTELKDALSKTQARLEAIGTLQVAMSLALDELAPGYSEKVFEQLRLMTQLAHKEGDDAQARVIVTIMHQIDKQLGLKAND